MQKPITVARQEFIEDIVGAVNTSGLPFFVIEAMLKDLLGSVQRGAEAQLEKDRTAYGEYLQEEAGEDTEKEDTGDPRPADMEG